MKGLQMKNKKLKVGVLLSICSMVAVTLYAANMSDTDKDGCYLKSPDQFTRTTCCVNGCSTSNSSQADISACTKDCLAYQLLA
jgi:hypothetical protein